MKNKSSVLPIVLTIALIVGGGFFLIVRANNRRRKDLEEKLAEEAERQQGGAGSTGTTTPVTGGTSSSSPILNYDFTFPIKYGNKGENVKQLQLLLMQYDNRILNPFKADGKFGSVTERAIKTIIGKTKIESQSDIELIKKKIAEKAKKISQQVALNLSLGLPIKTS